MTHSLNLLSAIFSACVSRHNNLRRRAIRWIYLKILKTGKNYFKVKLVVLTGTSMSQYTWGSRWLGGIDGITYLPTYFFKEYLFSTSPDAVIKTVKMLTYQFKFCHKMKIILWRYLHVSSEDGSLGYISVRMLDGSVYSHISYRLREFLSADVRISF